MEEGRAPDSSAKPLAQVQMMSPIAPNPLPVFRPTARLLPLILGVALAALGCNSDDSESFSVDGNWHGSVAEAEAEITMLLIKQGKNGIVGSAQITIPQEGEVPGTVEGFQKGRDVNFTIDVDAVFVGGSLAFEGVFESDDVMTGTIDSGLIGGTFPVSFLRQ